MAHKLVKIEKGFDKKELVPLTLILLMFIASSFLYSSMPEKMPIHWNSKGEIDGYGSRFTGLFLMPIITLIIYIVLSMIPKIAVYKKNIQAFYFYYSGFKIVFVLYMAALYLVMLLPNFGILFNMNFVIIPMIAGLIFFAGILMEKSKRNYFIGIRTPWTLASDNVWKKTHRIGGMGFKIIAVFMLFSLILGKYAILSSVGLLLIFVVYIFIYSYFVFKKENIDL
jgi:uncharacterized membrane protein